MKSVDLTDAVVEPTTVISEKAEPTEITPITRLPKIPLNFFLTIFIFFVLTKDKIELIRAELARDSGDSSTILQFDNHCYFQVVFELE